MSQPFPELEQPVLVRTNFSAPQAWKSVCEQAMQPTEDGFQANLRFLDQPSFDGLEVRELVKRLDGSYSRTFLFVFDDLASSDPEHPVLVVNRGDEPARSFRSLPTALQAVENNLSTGEMTFADFADNLDSRGRFRGL